MRNTYEVYCGNIGKVCHTHNQKVANEVYQEYKRQSKSNYGIAAGEPVRIDKNGEPLKEYNPST